MARSQELDRIKVAEQAAFKAKQAAWDEFQGAKERADAAYETMQAAWAERADARDEMNREYEAMQAASENYREVWDEYGRIRDENNYRIDALRREADYEHQEMKRCFDQASYEYEYGDRAMAPIYSQEGHEHKEQRDELNAEVSELCQEVKDARRDAEYRAPKTDSSAFKSAKTVFEQAKRHHQAAEAEFKRLKTERNRLKSVFKSAHAEHLRLKDEFQRKLEEIKAQNQRERDRVLDKAGVRWTDRDDAKIVKKADGTTQVYSGGLGKGDGLGHGHIALDRNGNKTYERGAFESHGGQNFTNNEPGGWTHREWGIIGDNHEVTFSLGTGKNSGQTLISDGFLSKRDFRSRHNHYGDNNKDLYPDQPNRIEDSSRHRNDGFYTGPGH